MKKIVFLAMLLVTVAGTMRAQVTTYKSTDTNTDGNVNISDVTNTTNVLLGQQAKSNDMVKVDDINVLLRQINAKLNAIAEKLDINLDNIDDGTGNTIPPNPSEIIAHSQERQSEDAHWENQIIIKANQALKQGDKCTLAFDYCLSPADPTSNVQEATVNFVLGGDFYNNNPTYYSWVNIPEITFKRDWQSFSATFEIPEASTPDISTTQLLSLYLSHIKEACNYHIKNVVWKIEKADGTVESLINTEGTENFYVIEGMGGVRPYTTSSSTESQTIVDLKIEDFRNVTCQSWGNDDKHIVSVNDNGVLSLYSRNGQKTDNTWECQCNIPEQGIGIKPGVEYTLKLVLTGSPQETIPAMIRSAGENSGNFSQYLNIPITGNRSTFETTFTVPADANTNAVELTLFWGQYIGEFYIFSLEVSHKE